MLFLCRKTKQEKEVILAGEEYLQNFAHMNKYVIKTMWERIEFRFKNSLICDIDITQWID